MDIFSSLLSGPTLATLAACLALGLVFRAITGLASEIPDLRIRFDKVKSRLDAQLTGIPAAKETIKKIQELVSPKKTAGAKIARLSHRADGNRTQKRHGRGREKERRRNPYAPPRSPLGPSVQSSTFRKECLNFTL